MNTSAAPPRPEGVPVIEPTEGMDREVSDKEEVQIYIKKDVERHGMTVGCLGCKAVNLGMPSANHAEECWKRME